MSESQSRRSGDHPAADVVALLMHRHGDIRNLFDEVEAAAGEQRREAYRRLVRVLAVHETAEEEVVHPFVRRAFPGGARAVEDRLAEEKAAKESLVTLDDLDTDDPTFMLRFMKLRRDVQEHARAEERYEFIHIRRSAGSADLAVMARTFKAAEALAPTRPYPGVESATANIALGAVIALINRTEGAVSRALGEDG
ncbi:hemerythrin domain-containing protein [Streptomyces sp. NPDC048018]|uniref:hemerythrin domain-containing protein n=1 Tax=Streptomyces sp. NPDC048018 TaxID=3365499 RepID=UPI00371D8A09